MSESDALRRVREALDSALVEVGRRSTELSRQGRYLEAIALLEQDLATWPGKLAAFPAEQTRPLLERWTQWQREGIAVLRSRSQWTDHASGSLAACKALLADLLSQGRWDVDKATLSDLRVQVLLDAARSLDLQAMQLFSARSVHVVVEAPALSEAQCARYAQGLSEDLRQLGLAASTERGDERFVVRVGVDGPHSVHYVHDTFCECSLLAEAEWEGSGLPRLDLTQHGCGDEEDGDCVDNCVKDGVHRAGRAVVLAWAGSPVK